ncbi:MAG: YbaN family protein [Candidatus Bathyarchaeota archaeon]|nr:MAG: YbaN family protein [Candidatus Bathyarchaeota archaeon]
MKGTVSDKAKQILFVFLGTIFLCIGCVGLIIPLLPTTPFLLLAAACYVRGSERLHDWMMNNRVFGKLIKNYLEKKGLEVQQKVFALVFLWLMIVFAIYYIVDTLLFRILLFLIAVVVSIHLFTLPSLKASSSAS